MEYIQYRSAFSRGHQKDHSFVLGRCASWSTLVTEDFILCTRYLTKKCISWWFILIYAGIFFAVGFRTILGHEFLKYCSWSNTWDEMNHLDYCQTWNITEHEVMAMIYPLEGVWSHSTVWAPWIMSQRTPYCRNTSSPMSTGKIIAHFLTKMP